MQSRLSASSDSPRRGYGQAVLSSEVDRITQAPETTRHKTILDCSRRVGRYVAGGEIAYDWALPTLVRAGMTHGFARSDVEKHVRHGLAYGMRQPRRAPEGGTILAGRADVIEWIATRWLPAVHTDPAFRSSVGATTQRILVGVARVACHAGKLRLELSQRQLAEAAGVDRRTIASHHPALSPYLRLVRRGSRQTGQPACWQMTLPAMSHECPIPEGCPTGDPVWSIPATTPDPAADALHRRSGDWRVLALLDRDDSQPAKALAEATGLTRSTIHRILKRLAAQGLAARKEDGWLATGAALPAGDRPWAEQRKQRHEAERKRYKKRKADRAAEQEADTELTADLRRARALQQQANRMRKRAMEFEKDRSLPRRPDDPPFIIGHQVRNGVEYAVIDLSEEVAG